MRAGKRKNFNELGKPEIRKNFSFLAACLPDSINQHEHRWILRQLNYVLTVPPSLTVRLAAIGNEDNSGSITVKQYKIAVDTE